MDVDKLDLVTRLQLEKKGNIHGSIYHITQVEMAYNSNKIEGSRLSEKQTALIFENNIVPPADSGEATKLDDIKEAENHFKGFDYILDNYDQPLSLESIKQIQGILKKGTSDEENPLKPVGEFKIIENVIGIGYTEIETASPENVAQRLEKLIDEYQNNLPITLEKIVDFHVKFERIHPFADGNGRTGRLLMFKECLKHNITPFVLKDVHRDFYYRGLSSWDDNKGFLLDTIGMEQDMYQEFLNRFKFKGDINDKNRPKNKFEERLSKESSKQIPQLDERANKDKPKSL
ncbi:Fic family protein [Enterococcus faecium]|nr:Fic family protein [Enterococcus faecium]